MLAEILGIFQHHHHLAHFRHAKIACQTAEPLGGGADQSHESAPGRQTLLLFQLLPLLRSMGLEWRTYHDPLVSTAKDLCRFIAAGALREALLVGIQY
jgi:hypothetical protein